MEARSIFAAVIHDVHTNSQLRTGRPGSGYPSALIVEASSFLVDHITSAGHSPQVETFVEGQRTFIIFPAPAETVSKYTPGDIINIKAVRTPEGLWLSL